MSDESRRILDLLAHGKISVDEADQLLRALGQAPPDSAAAEPGERKNRWQGIFGVGALRLPSGDAPGVRYLKIEVNKPGVDGARERRVKIKVPIALVRGGMRLGAIVGACADDDVRRGLRERGIDLDLSAIDEGAIADLLKNLGELTVDVDKGSSQVRITCE
jgi:SHOCT-like protein